MRFVSSLLAVILLLIMVTPIGAADTEVRIRLYSGDGASGNGCTVFTWDADLSNGIANGNGPDCTLNWNNTVESISINQVNGACWKLYTGANYSGTVYNFSDTFHDGFYELPGNQDNIFSSISRGVQGAGSNCIAQHP